MGDLFSDGFESGDLSAWDGSVIDGGDLSAENAAALHGLWGLNCLIDDATSILVYDETPNNETRYRLRFYIDTNGLTMGAGNAFALIDAMNGAWDTQFYVFLKHDGVNYQIYVSDFADGGWDATAAYDITDGIHWIEVDWTASSGPGNNDGQIVLIIDGVTKETKVGIDSDTESISICAFGAASGIDSPATNGIFFLDDFASNDDGSAIGPIIEANPGFLLNMMR